MTPPDEDFYSFPSHRKVSREETRREYLDRVYPKECPSCGADTNRCKCSKIGD